MKGFLVLLVSILSFSGASGQDARELAAAKEQFAVADRELNAVYQTAKARLPGYRFEEIQEEQRDWITYRDDRSLAGAQFDGGAREGSEKENPSYWETAAALTESRTEILRGWLKADQFGTDWEGVWSDGFGGRLYLRETGPGGVEFYLSVVRGPTYHLGEIGGLAITNGQLARFAIEAILGEPDGETWLTFHRENGRLRIIGVNTQYFHGARAYFDGEYVRVRELSQQDHQEMRRGIDAME